MNKPLNFAMTFNYIIQIGFQQKNSPPNMVHFANHYALLVTEELLKTLDCHNIFELRELFLKNGFQENTSLSIRNCREKLTCITRLRWCLSRVY